MKNKYLMGLIAFLMASVSGFAAAALPAGVATAFTAIQTDGLALIDLVWPVMTAITVGFILLRLFKRGASAAV